MEARKFFRLVKEKAFGKNLDDCKEIKRNVEYEAALYAQTSAFNAVLESDQWEEVASIMAQHLRAGEFVVPIHASKLSPIFSSSYIQELVDGFSNGTGYRRCENYNRKELVGIVTQAIIHGIKNALKNLGYTDCGVSTDLVIFFDYDKC